jgi:hypothetical protein
VPRVHTALADASWSFGSEEKGVGVAAMRDSAPDTRFPVSRFGAGVEPRFPVSGLGRSPVSRFRG